MFVAGCRADQNPIPRRTLELAAGYGKQLAESVEEALRGPLTLIDSPIRTGYEEIALAFASLPPKEQIERDTSSNDFYIASRARHLVQTIERKGQLDSAGSVVRLCGGNHHCGSGSTDSSNRT